MNGTALARPFTPPMVFHPLAVLRRAYLTRVYIDNWHFYGTQYYIPDDARNASTTTSKARARANPPRPAPTSGDGRPPLTANKSTRSETTQIETPSSPSDRQTREVVARVSTHMLRLERDFSLLKHIVAKSDPEYKHFVRPLELIRLPARSGGEPIVVSIFEAPGRNYLKDIVEYGPNAYNASSPGEENPASNIAKLSLLKFMSFAIGAAECCEILHHGNRMVHGEIRGDAFHFNQETNRVKMINLGSGSRAFENGLSSAGWATLSRERGVEHKLQFIAPEQTGRLPAEPNSRTDLYSLGVLFWMMLTAEPAHQGDSPLAIMQNVLSRRIPPVSSRRSDLPDVLSQVISRLTAKNIEERYNSASGLKYDLVQIQDMLSEGNVEGLRNFKIASRDISAFFNLPSYQVGREKEKKQIIAIVKSVVSYSPCCTFE